jgi:hypothetical protein
LQLQPFQRTATCLRIGRTLLQAVPFLLHSYQRSLRLRMLVSQALELSVQPVDHLIPLRESGV